jgi:hypothetical protein
MNNSKEILEEIMKCKNNPYYFATKYLTIKSSYCDKILPFTTIYSEEEFNKMINTYGKING